MEGRPVTLPEMLAARERRAARQRALLAEYGKPLLSFTLNVAGPVKNSPLLRRGFRLGRQLLEDQLPRCLHSEFTDAATGCEGLFVFDLDAASLKALCVEVEDDRPEGRLFDLDVLDEGGGHVDRASLGLAGRKCLLCGNPAKQCARSRAHTVEALQAETARLLQAALGRQRCDAIASLACRSLLYEASATPKPGLVDRQNSGSHRDMDFFSFMASAPALWPYFRRCAEIGMETAGEGPKETFRRLRLPGKQAERAMKEATGGVNTHKGAIFSLGILCGALGRLETWEGVLRECAAMTEGLTEADFRGVTLENAATAGERFYVQYGLTGVRGQAEAGFPAVREAGLPTLERGLAAGLSLNDAGCAALLAILAHTEDTNLIARGGIQAQREAANRIAALLARNPFPDRETLEALDRAFIEKNLSPGGSADLLAITYFLHFLTLQADD